MELKNLREQIDQIDHEIIIRILQRRELIRQVAEYKTEHHLPVFAPRPGTAGAQQGWRAGWT